MLIPHSPGKLESVESECTESSEKVEGLEQVVEGLRGELKVTEEKLAAVNTQGEYIMFQSLTSPLTQ